MSASRIRRRRRRMSRRRRVWRTVGKVLLWLLVIPALIGGYYLAQYLFTRSTAPVVNTDPVPAATTTAGETAPTKPTEPDPKQDPEPEGVFALAKLRAVWLPLAALRDVPAWDATLSGAASAGFNAVIVDLKDADGRVWYASATAAAAEARSVQETALSAEELKTAGQALKEYGLTLVPRLFAFRDNLAPRHLAAARVSVAGSPQSVWYDNDPAAGGRRWLNPYAAAARGYITGLAKELAGMGFSTIVLDGVQFPAQESSAWYGDASVTATPRNEVLAQFAKEMNAAVGSHWLYSLTAPAAVGEKTAVYGGNPVAYGVPGIAPWMTLSDLGSRLTVGEAKVSNPASHPYEAASLLFEQMKARLQLLSSDTPASVPWLAPGNSADTLRALHEQFGADAPYILYDAAGKYTFG